MASPTGKESTELEAIIVGAGFSGIASACRIQLDLGLKNFKVFEKDSSWGGTWHVSTFPGAGCDIPARLYSLSFSQRTNWPSFFTPQKVVESYLCDVADQFDLNRRTHFRHAVQTATFDEKNAHWVVTVRDLETGKVKRHTARVFFSCVGALSVPRECDIKGADSFKGAIFHSARWDKAVSLKGKKVVLIGNGCTAAQIVPNIAEEVKQLTQIIRSKHWIVPQLKNPLQGPFFEWLERNLPGFVGFERMAIITLLESHFLQTFIKEGKGARERFASVSRDYVTRCAPKEYHDMIIPRPGELEVSCKRRIYDDGYIVSLGRPNVELTNDQAREIVDDGIILDSGRKVEADVIVLANGFQTDQFACQVEIRNGKGQRLEEYWRQEKGAPQSIERAVEMATRVLRPLFLTGKPSLSPLQRSHGKSIRVRPEAEDLEQDFIQDAMKGLIFSTGCGSWYTDDSGRVTAVNPSFQTTVAIRARFPYYYDYDYRGVSDREAWRSWTVATRIGSLLALGATPRVAGSTHHGIIYRLLASPFHLIRYLAARFAIRSLQTLAFVMDFVFRHKRPSPFIASNAMLK
jgi:cation diffusion facilitator CzcD-associated flavoprotein CzcO